MGPITPSALHSFGITRGFIVPDIDPDEHRLMIHGMVDRELIFMMDELKRFPSVTRLHFIECAGNRSSSRHRTIIDELGRRLYQSLPGCNRLLSAPIWLVIKLPQPLGTSASDSQGNREPKHRSVNSAATERRTTGRISHGSSSQ